MAISLQRFAAAAASAAARVARGTVFLSFAACVLVAVTAANAEAPDEAAPEAGAAPQEAAAGLAPGDAGRPPVTRLSDAFRAASPEEGLDVRVERVRREASAMGMRSAEPAARGLLLATDLGSEAERARAATRLAPGLPAAWGALARSSGSVTGLGHLARGVFELERNLVASLWWRATATRVVAWALVGGGILFLLLCAVRATSRARHDLSHRFGGLGPGLAQALVAALLVAILMPAWTGEGLAGLAVGAFAWAFLWAPGRERVPLLAAIAGVGLAIYPLTAETGRWIAALHADPDTLSVRSAHVGDLSTAERERLAARAPNDPAAAYALAQWSRRSGDLDGAERWLAAIGEPASESSVVLNQVANLRLARGDGEGAIASYRDAYAARRRAEIQFNLAQVHGSRIELAEQQAALEAAHSISGSTVRELAELRGDGRLAVDLAWPVSDLRRRLGAAAEGGPVAAALRDPFGRGRLTGSTDPALAAFGAVAVLGLALGRGRRAGQPCGACGERRCEDCDLGAGDADERRCSLCGGPWANAPLRALRSLTARFADRCVPGAAGLSAGRPWLALVSCLTASFAAAAIALRNGVVADPFAVGLVGPFAFASLATLALFVYAGTTFAARRARA